MLPVYRFLSKNRLFMADFSTFLVQDKITSLHELIT